MLVHVGAEVVDLAVDQPQLGQRVGPVFQTRATDGAGAGLPDVEGAVALAALFEPLARALCQQPLAREVIALRGQRRYRGARHAGFVATTGADWGGEMEG